MAEPNQEPIDVAGCLSDMLMRSNDFRSVMVIAITKDHSMIRAWAANYPDRLAMAKYVDAIMTDDCIQAVREREEE